MNEYKVNFDEVFLQNTKVDLNSQKLYEIFEELIQDKCKLLYEDEHDYGFTLLFRQLQKNKEEYIKSIDSIEKDTRTDLDSHLKEETKKNLKDLL